MIELDFLQSLIRALDESGLDSIDIERGGTRVRLSKTPQQTVVTNASSPAGAEGGAAAGAPAPAGAPGAGDPGASQTSPAPDVPADHLVDIKSPMVGTFYRAPAPDAPSYVEEGGRIAKGDTLCIIEAMKLMNELEAEIAGTVREVLVENAEPVEFGQVLFRVDPA